MNKRHNGILGLIRLMKGQRHRVLLAVVAGVLAQGGTLASLALGAVIVGQAIVAPDADTLITGCAGMALLVLFTAGARWWQGWASHDLAFMLIEKLQMAIFDGLERAAPLTASGQRLGELASVATADAERMERFYAHTLADYIAAFIVPLAALALLYLLDPLLMLVMLPFLLLVASVPRGWRAMQRGRGKRSPGSLGSLTPQRWNLSTGCVSWRCSVRRRSLCCVCCSEPGSSAWRSNATRPAAGWNRPPSIC